MLEAIFGQVIRILITTDNIDFWREGITRKTKTTDTMTTEQDRRKSQTKVSLAIGAVTVTTHNHLQRQEYTHPSRISADNPDRIHLTAQCLIVSETKIRAKIYLTIRSSRPTIMVISQT